MSVFGRFRLQIRTVLLILVHILPTLPNSFKPRKEEAEPCTGLDFYPGNLNSNALLLNSQIPSFAGGLPAAGNWCPQRHWGVNLTEHLWSRSMGSVSWEAIALESEGERRNDCV